MHGIFRAVKDRFNADKQLVKKCRRIYEGYSGERKKTTLPYAEVTMTGTLDLDTFTGDVTECYLTFWIHDKGQTGDKAAEARDELMRVFDDAKLETSEFVTASFRKTNAAGPVERGGTYSASVTYATIIELKQQTPGEKIGRAHV